MRTWLWSCSLALLAACAGQPERASAPLPVPQAYGPEALPAQIGPAGSMAAGGAQRFVAGLEVPARWWTRFGSAQLDALVARALEHNPDLAAARAALLAANESLLAQQAQRLPSLQASYQATRQRNPVGTLAPTLSSGDAVFNLHTAQVTVSYLPDVFGLAREQIVAQRAVVDIQRFQLEAAYQSLIGNVVLAAIQQAALHAQLEANQALLRGQRAQLQVLQRQAALGAIAAADVLSQQAAVAQTEAAVPALRKALAQQDHLMAVLAGALPAEAQPVDFRLEEFQLPEELPLSLPATLLEHRPDIQAAAAQMRAAAAGVGVAWSSRLPQLRLDASAGGSSTRLTDLFAPGNVFWNLGVAAGQTVFDGGALAHRQHAAEAGLVQAQALYRSAVLNGCQNVADVLQALQQDAASLAAAFDAAAAAAESARVARQVLALGGSSSLPVLLAEQSEQQSRLAVIQAQANRQADTVALFQALGGGWWNRNEDTARP